MSNKSSYLGVKALYHEESMKKILNKEQPYPTHIELVISDLCNHDCKFCSYRMSNYLSNTLFQETRGGTRKDRNPNRQISKEKCFEIIDDCVEMGVKAIQFTGGGEPTIHPNFVEIVQYAQDKGLDTALVTNGNMLHVNEVRQVCINMVWVRVSIDASSSVYYGEVRGVPEKSFYTMIGGLMKLCAEAKAENSSVVIGTGFVTTPENHDQIYEAVRLFKLTGAQHVRVGLQFSNDWEKPFIPLWSVIRDQSVRAVKDFDDKGFAVIDRTQQRFDEFAGRHVGKIDYEFCGFQNFTNFIGGDLNVYRCCQFAFHPRGLIGSIKDQRLKDFYDSELKKKDFASFNAKQCGNCQFHGCNKAIDAVKKDPDILNQLGNKPDHINFV